ncbi:MAG: hypothetical protein QNJ98_09935 [Planctomycetota bacterium]|nr:hypothetical protein [Planctomycetota bacterium]
MIRRPDLRPLLWIALLGAGVAFAPDAAAHGGGFKNPQMPNQPQEAPSDVPLPVVPTTGGTPGGANPSAGNRAFFLQEDWRVWWILNSPELLPARGVIEGANVTEAAGPFELGGREAGSTSAWEMARRKVVTETVYPHLLDLVDPSTDTPQAIRAAALIALGRIAREPVPLSIFERYALDPDASVEVRESAVMGLGLLRRSDPTMRLPVDRLTRVREFLLQLFDDKDAPNRVRAFAAYAIGLLADQPYPGDAIHRDGRDMTRELWRRVPRKYASADLRIALLTALGLQPRAGVPSGVRDDLRYIVVGRNVGNRRWDGFERSHALTALARLDRASCLPILVRVLGNSRQHVSVRTASVLALAEWAPRLGAADRLWIADALRKAWHNEPNWQAQGLYLITLGKLVNADLDEGRDRMIKGPNCIGAFLARECLDGSTMERPFAALGLGLCVHELEPQTRTTAAFVRSVHGTLEQGLHRRRGSAEAVSAYAVGLGLSRAVGARDALFEIVAEKKNGGFMRGEACVALALTGARDLKTRELLRRLLTERRSSLVFLGAVKALSMIGTEGTVELLVQQLHKTRSIGGQTAIAAGLGRLGDLAAAEPLIQIIKSRQKSVYTRTMCVVALGLICDPEPKPSRRRLTAGANYPARTAAMQQVFNIL